MFMKVLSILKTAILNFVCLEQPTDENMLAKTLLNTEVSVNTENIHTFVCLNKYYNLVMINGFFNIKILFNPCYTFSCK